MATKTTVTAAAVVAAAEGVAAEGVGQCGLLLASHKYYIHRQLKLSISQKCILITMKK